MGQRLFIYAAIAVSLGVISPEVAHMFDLAVTHDRSGVFYWWFIGLPAGVDLALKPSDGMRLALWSATYSVMYLALFAVVGAVVSAIESFRHRNDDHSEAFDTAAAQFTQHDW